MFKYKIVMVVDDDELDGFIIKKTIEDNHFAEKVINFLSAKNALKYLKSNESNPDALPSIIFLDIIMDDMDGFGFLDEFAKMNDVIHSKCKIVLLSTSKSFENLNRANKNKFAAKFLIKPLTKEVLDAINF